MKKLLTFLTLLTLFFTTAWAETVYKTLDFATATMSKYVNAYDSEFNATISDGSSWLVKCFNNGTSNSPLVPIRAGRKNTASVASIATAVSSPIDKAITKVVVTVDAVNINHLNSTKLQVADNANFTGTSVQNINVTITASGEITYTVPTPTENQYYKLVYNLNENVASNGTLRISKVEYYYNESGSTPTTYSVNLNQTTGGTISASPTTAAEGATVTLTATPNPGYEFTRWEVLDGDANEVTVTNNQFTMPASDVEVEATFTALQTYGITVTGGTASPTSAYAGQTVTVTPTIPEGKVVDQIITIPASLTLTASGDGYTFTMPDEAVTVNFTFKDAPTYTNVFERITSTDDLETGVRYLLVYEDANKAAGTTEGTNKYLSSISTTIANNTITLDENSSIVPFTLSGSEGSYKLADPQGRFITPTAAKSLKLDAEGNVTAGITFSGNNVLINFGSSLGIMYYNTSSPRFLNYTSEQGFIQLYKEVAETTTDKLYLIGSQMNSQSGWNLSTGPEFTYSSSAGTYAVDAYFDMAERGYFQFVEGLSDSNSNWSGLTGRYYASSNDADVAVDNYAMNGTVGLYFTNSTSYSPGQYAFTVPAGMYTIVVDKTNWQVFVTQKPVTMTISPNSATFEDTKNVTLASNLTELGGKIYYTTDGTTPSATNGTEYTGTITLEATTTIKAIAILNYIQSEVVEKTYIKTPAAPVITPASCTFNEPLTVNITAESGATIYYTTDGSNPTSSNGTQYTGSFTVSATTTVKARAYVGEVYSSIAEATYTYSNVQPSTGDFVLVTSASQLVAGNEYIIMSYDNENDYAMGSISNTRGNPVTDFTLSGTLGANGSTVSVGTTVNVLTLGGTTGAWTLKQADENYIIPAASATGISTGSACNLVITIGNDYVANIQNSETTDTRQIRYSTSGYFRNYATSQSSTNDIYLYTRESNTVQPPVFTPAAGLYDVAVDVTIDCATTGASIYYTTDGTEPSAANGTLYDGNEIVVSQTTTIKAIAIKGENSSTVVEGTYTITPHTAIETVTLDYTEPFTNGIGKFYVSNESGFSPVWTLDGNYGIKGTSYSNGTNYAAVSRFLSPIIDMTNADSPQLTFSHQINSYFDDVTTQATLWIRETTNGTSGTWIQLPLTFSTPASGGWTNNVATIDLSDYAGKKVQISFLYTNPTEGSGAGTWEIQQFKVAESGTHYVNNIAEFLALDENTVATFRNPVTVLYDYAQTSSHEYIWVKDESGYMQFYVLPSLNESQQAFYENGDIIPAGFTVTKNYYEYGAYVQAYSDDALNAGFVAATQKGLADPDYYGFSDLNSLAVNDATIKEHCNRYITLEKIKIASKTGKNFTFADENGTVNACVGYNKFSDEGTTKKDGNTAIVDVPAAGDTYYNVKAILQLWKGSNNDTKWEILPIEFTEWKPAEVTLRKLCADGVENNEYIISNNLLGVYASADGTKLWVKDDTGQSIWPATPTDGDLNFDVYAEAAEGIPANTRLTQAYYDQSNWCEIQLTGTNASDFVGKIIKGGSIDGTFSDKTNPTMTGVTLTNDHIYSAGSYAPNYYMPANFTGRQQCTNGSHSTDFEAYYFFMTPKPQEYAQVVWAVWNSQNQKFIMSTSDNANGHRFEGEFAINLEMNDGVSQTSEITDGYGYNFKAIVRKTASKADGFMVYPLDLDEGINPATSINTVDVTGKAVKSVKYVNVAGIVSDHPFQGVNIVVTEYTDGTRTTSKMLCK